MRNTLTLLAYILLISLYSCEKEAGEGGMATIRGKVIIEDYNFDFTILRDTYPAQAYDVYIIYGKDEFYSDKIETSYDGYYEFNYLREGDYKIFAYSKDKTLDYNETSERIAIIKEVSITSKKQTVQVEDIIVAK
ncbi:hypothetical protein [Plebeiibacterium marinum]|uniref:Uncharacterized protein n=1 Tax=Plebeiibacterium marinum TaxID=2992111 RepID=A0AAE3MAT7_9BACT|nr:hypothetical protein [Plebeiobacterium marinum]MCW3804179.1 hypothetical protein [Plebeiobacterium marinum]